MGPLPLQNEGKAQPNNNKPSRAIAPPPKIQVQYNYQTY